MNINRKSGTVCSRVNLRGVETQYTQTAKGFSIQMLRVQNDRCIKTDFLWAFDNSRNQGNSKPTFFSISKGVAKIVERLYFSL